MTAGRNANRRTNLLLAVNPGEFSDARGELRDAPGEFRDASGELWDAPGEFSNAREEVAEQ